MSNNTRYHVTEGHIIEFMYTDGKGERSKRRVVNQEFFLGTSEHHTDLQMMIKGFDLDRLEVQIYATNDIDSLKAVK